MASLSLNFLLKFQHEYTASRIMALSPFPRMSKASNIHNPEQAGKCSAVHAGILQFSWSTKLFNFLFIF
jgi:hypothetical protein